MNNNAKIILSLSVIVPAAFFGEWAIESIQIRNKKRQFRKQLQQQTTNALIDKMVDIVFEDIVANYE